MSEPLLSVKNMKKTFQANGGMFSKKKFVHAVNDVSFDIYPGETFSLVGESGCGKSTTGKLIDHLITPDSGVDLGFEGKRKSPDFPRKKCVRCVLDISDGFPGSIRFPESENESSGSHR